MGRGEGKSRRVRGKSVGDFEGERIASSGESSRQGEIFAREGEDVA